MKTTRRGPSTRAVARFVLAHPENSRARLRASARMIAWMLFRRFGRAPRTIRWIDDLDLRWYPDSISVGNAWLCGLLEWREMRFVRDVVRPGDLFVDVGANVGVYTLLAARSPGADVVAFEPGRVARERLTEHVALNDLTDRVEVLPFALGGRSGEAQFTVGQDVLNHVVAEGNSSPGTETVQIRRLDDVIGARSASGSTFLKVDAEGHDVQVLEGARRVLEQVRPVVVVEFNDLRVRELLEPLGYSTYAYEAGTRKLRPTGWERSGTSNLLAIADLAPIEARLASVSPPQAPGG